MSQKLSTELNLSSDAGDRATIKNLPASVMQAMYREFTGRTESLSRIWEENYVFSHEDIVQLVERLKQSLGQYQTKIVDVQFKSSFLNNSSQTYTSLMRFKSFDYSFPEKTTAVEIVFSFLVATPDHGSYQNYRVIVELSSYWLEKSGKNLMYGRANRGSAITLKVEYVDYIIAANISSTIEEWLKTLDKTLPDSVVDKASDIRYENIQNAFQIISIVCVALGWFASTFYFDLSTQPINIIRWVIGSGASIILASVFARWIHAVFEMYCWSSGKFPFIILNKADQRNFDIFKSKRAMRDTLFNRITLALCTGIGINILAAIVMIAIGLQKL